MRSRGPAADQVAEVARRRLELLSAELAELRLDAASATTGDAGDPGDPGDSGNSGHPDGWVSREPEPDGRPASGGAAGRHAYRPVGRGAALAGWIGDRLPPTLQGRVALHVSHLLVVLLVVASGVGVTVWWVARSDDGSTALPPVAEAPSPLAAQPSPLPTGGGRAPSPSTSSADGPSDGTAAGTVVVDVAGKVRRPGIAELPVGSRVVDALEAAGGPRRGVRLGTLNLARVLVDGEQVVVGLPAAGVGAPSAGSGVATPDVAGGAAPTPLVNINTASQAELEELPGVGPVTAQAILELRSRNGAFTAVDDLLEVSGIGEKTLADLAPYVTL